MSNKSKYRNDLITVTKPAVPDLDEFIPYLESIWEEKWLTNNGKYHRELEDQLSDFLDIENISLCSNGTLALILALKALDVKGEVITTPFSFVATSHAISWSACTPVFADIDPSSLNLDPGKVEKLINEKTSAIMPVHVYGNPCDHEKFQKLADKYKLKLIYDAAHAFNVKKDDKSILNWGDLSVLSFHATKVFNTFEGGAVVSHSKEMKKKIDDLKNFGIQNETTVTDIGINAKMNEVQAAMGLVQLKHVDEMIAKRRSVAKRYDKGLKNINGLDAITVPQGVDGNYSYYPILVNENLYGMNRDELYEFLKSNSILTRRYFYPLISDFSMYSNSEFCPQDLSYSKDISKKILCLPIYSELEVESVDRILNLLAKK